MYEHPDARAGLCVLRPVVICEISQTWWVRDRKWKSVTECASPTRCVLYRWLPYGCLSSLSIYIVTACQRNHMRERSRRRKGGGSQPVNVFYMCVITCVG